MHSKKTQYRQKNINLLILALVVTILWGLVAYFTLSGRVEAFKHEKYNEVSKKMKNEIEVLIDEKREATLIIALSLAYNSDIKKSLSTHVDILGSEEIKTYLYT